MIRTTLSLCIGLLAWASVSSAATKTQVIRCLEDRTEHIVINMTVEGSYIVTAEVTFWGKYITPGLYRGQSLGSEAFVYTERKDRRLVGLAGGGTDVSSDNPYMFRIAFPRSILGRNLKKGTFPLYFEHLEDRGSYSAYKTREFYEMLDEMGALDRHPSERANQWGKYCWTYTR